MTARPRTLSELLMAHEAALSMLQELIDGNIEATGATLRLSARAAHGLTSLLSAMIEELAAWQQALPFPLTEYRLDVELEAFVEALAHFRSGGRREGSP